MYIAYEYMCKPIHSSGLAAVVVRDRIYCLGGYDGRSFLSTVESFDPRTGEWHAESPMPSSRSAFAATVVSGRLFAIGGNDGRSLSTVESLDLCSGVFLCIFVCLLCVSVCRCVSLCVSLSLFLPSRH